MTNRAQFIAVLVVMVLPCLDGCGGSDLDEDVEGVRRNRLKAISVTPSNAQIAVNSTAQFTATGIYANNATRDLTAAVTWQTTAAEIVSVSNSRLTKGQGTARNAGTASIIAAYGGVSGNATVTVTSASLQSLAITPVQPNAAQGTQQQFTATGTYSDNSVQDLTASVTWVSSSIGVATISDTASSKGLSTAVSPGTSTISASLGTVAANTALTVTPATLIALAVAPANPSLPVGLSRQFSVTGTYSDNSTRDLTTAAIWSSSNTAVVKPTDLAAEKGLFSAVAVGSATIGAASGSLSTSTTVNVTPATLTSLSIAPADPSVALGTSRQFTATGTYSDRSTQNLTSIVAWYSSDTHVATVSNATGSKGLGTSVAVGSTQISAATGSLSVSTTFTVTPATLVSIAVNPANRSIVSGTSVQYTATGTYTDATSQDITATAMWSASDPAVASVSNATGSKGLGTGIGPGTATISATSNAISGSTPITVTAAGSGTIALAWDPATAYSDGSSITDLTGYRVYYGTAPGSYSSSIDVGNVTSYTIAKLSPGVYYVVVTVRNLSGAESSYSNEVSKTIF